MGEEIGRYLEALSLHRRGSEPPESDVSGDQSWQIGYWMERQEEEEAAFLDALDPRVRDVHHELAERYADAIWGAQEAEFETCPSLSTEAP